MSRRDLGLLLILAAAPALLGSGCSAPAPTGVEDPHASCRAELDEARRHAAEGEAELRARLDLLSDEFELQARQVVRLERELEAARASTGEQNNSLKAAMALLRQRDEELEQLRAEAQAPTPPEGELAGAARLLRDKEEHIRRLQEELALARGGAPRQVPPEIAGGIQRVTLDLDRPVARIDGAPVTRREFVDFLFRDLGSPQLLELYLNRLLVMREGRRRGLEVSDVDAQVWVERQLIEQIASAGSEEEFARRLAEEGFTRQAWEARLRFQARAALTLDRLVAAERTTPAGREAWEARLKQAYQDAYGERVSARHILLRLPPAPTQSQIQETLRRAEALRQQLEQGANFSELARRASQDPESAKLGGYLGEVDRRRYASLPELNAALFSLGAGQLSRPIHSAAGIHLVLVEKHQQPTKTFEEARDLLAHRLGEEAPSDAESQALVRRLRSEAKLELALTFADD